MLKVSVITVSYNAAKFIDVAICSVLGQTYPNIEYIIVDGASTDGTMAVIDRYQGRIARVISEADKGVYDAMNKAVAVATGEVLYFLGADDRLFDACVIDDVVRAFDDERVDIVHGMVQYVNAPRSRQGTVLGVPHGNRPMSTGYEMIRYLPCHQACFCRKSLFDRYGSFDISYRITADFNWLLKAVSSGSRLQFIDRNVAFFNVNGISSSLSGTFLESARAILRWYGVAGLLCHIFWRGVNVCSFIGCGLFQGCSGNDQVKPEDIPRKAPEL